MRHRTHRRLRAFTLIEAMASAIVMTTLGSITAFLLIDLIGNSVDAATGVELHAELSVAVDRVTREFRNIQLDPDVSSQTAPHISLFERDLQIDWEDDDQDAYSLVKSGSQITLKINGGTAEVLLKDVTAMAMSAYDEDDNLLGASLSGSGTYPIRRLTFDVTVSRDGVTESLRTKVFIRSTMQGAD